MDCAPLHPLLAIVGPTATGKSALAIELATRLDGEIVSADSRQVYRGLNIGTGKVTREERAHVPHHLLDVADVRTPFNVATYQQLAFDAIDQIVARDRLPILVGGSGLYVRAVVDNPAYPPVPPDESVRAALEQQSLEQLVAQLELIDPLTAARIDRHNARRVIRALEVTLVSGIPLSHFQATSNPRLNTLQIGLDCPRPLLRQRIDVRVDRRLKSEPSMLDEVRDLLTQGIPAERLLQLGLEYRYLTLHLLGQLTYPQMTDELKRAILRFAKRQVTWFKRDHRIVWLEPGEGAITRALELAQAFLDPRPASRGET